MPAYVPTTVSSDMRLPRREPAASEQRPIAPLHSDAQLAAEIQRLLLNGGLRIDPATGSVTATDAGTVYLSDIERAAPPASRAAKDIVPADYTKPFLDFINGNPTVFHAVGYFSERLDAAGFVKLRERDDWKHTLKAGGKYYLVRNGSSLVAFSVPDDYKPGHGIGTRAPPPPHERRR